MILDWNPPTETPISSLVKKRFLKYPDITYKDLERVARTINHYHERKLKIPIEIIDES